MDFILDVQASQHMLKGQQPTFIEMRSLAL